MYLIFKLLEKIYPNNSFLKDDINGKRFFTIFLVTLIVFGALLLLIKFWY